MDPDQGGPPLFQPPPVMQQTTRVYHPQVPPHQRKRSMKTIGWEIAGVAVTMVVGILSIRHQTTTPIKSDVGTALVRGSDWTLLTADVDVNAKGANGSTELMRAAATGKADLVKAQIAARADVNAKAGDTRTALMYAAIGGWPDCAKLLIAARADVNAMDADGDTPLADDGKNIRCLSRMRKIARVPVSPHARTTSSWLSPSVLSCCLWPFCHRGSSPLQRPMRDHEALSMFH